MFKSLTQMVRIPIRRPASAAPMTGVRAVGIPTGANGPQMAGFSVPGANYGSGIALTWIALAVSILVHLLLVLWGSGSLASKPTTPQDDAISVLLVPDEKKPTPPRPPPEPEIPAAKRPPPNPVQAQAAGKPPSATPATPRPAKPGKVSARNLAGLTPDEIDALIAQVKFCWDIPTGWTEPRQVTVTIRFFLDSDGSLNGPPEVIEFNASMLGKTAADSALNAVVGCSPFDLPADKYEHWKDVQLRFEP